jgi:hypothetical protein
VKNNLLISLTITILIYSCEKSSYLAENDPNYPTIIEKVDAEKLSNLRTQFALQNIYPQTSLDEYGFCGIAEDNTMAPDPSIDTTVSRSEAIEIAEEFIFKNSQFTGVKDIIDLDFRKVEEMHGFWDGNKGWHLVTSNQRVDTMEVLSTSILINLRGREVIYCLGNWFPDIYIPKKFNVTVNEAKGSLLNRILVHYGWGGPTYVKITSESLRVSTIWLVVYPVEFDDHKEIRVAWKIYLPQVSYILYVDVMTGDVIGETPTIIA